MIALDNLKVLGFGKVFKLKLICVMMTDFSIRYHVIIYQDMQGKYITHVRNRAKPENRISLSGRNLDSTMERVAKEIKSREINEKHIQGHEPRVRLTTQISDEKVIKGHSRLKIHDLVFYGTLLESTLVSGEEPTYFELVDDLDPDAEVNGEGHVSPERQRDFFEKRSRLFQGQSLFELDDMAFPDDDWGD